MDANKILGMLMQSGMARSGTSRAQRLAGSGQGGGGLASIAGALLGGGSQRGGGIADALLGGGGQGGGGIADIAGALLGGGSGRAGGGVAASGGAMAILSSLAGVAMQHFGSAQGSAAPGLAEEAAPYDTDPDSRAMIMIRAMITAAKADGEIDPQEKQRILGRLEEAGADPDAQAFVQAEMAKPVDVDAIVERGRFAADGGRGVHRLVVRDRRRHACRGRLHAPAGHEPASRPGAGARAAPEPGARGLIEGRNA